MVNFVIIIIVIVTNNTPLTDKIYLAFVVFIEVVSYPGQRMSKASIVGQIQNAVRLQCKRKHTHTYFHSRILSLDKNVKV